MSERKSRFGDRSALPEDPALRVLQLRRSPESSSGPITYPGRAAAADQEALVVRIKKAREEANASREALEAERAKRQEAENEGMLLMWLDPEQVGLTEFANRNKLSLSSTDEGFKAFKESIRKNGQDTPIRVRPAAPGSAVPYELVEGHRRHAAIRELNCEIEGGRKILARLDVKASEIPDLCAKMYRENADREELCAFDTGTMFANWLEKKVWKTQREIAALTGLKESTVSQYLTIATLPSEVLAAFVDVRAIAMRWSPALAKACKDHPAETLARAKKLAKASPRPDAEAVYKALTAGVPAGRKARSSKKSDMVYVDDRVLFKIALKDRHLTFSRWQVDPDLIPALYEDTKAFFDEWLKTHSKGKS